MRLYNSLSRQVEPFTPQHPRSVTMYVCGPTVYDTPHLGNARPAVVFDVLFRLLRTRYDDVTYARNLTDIDDKIMERAAANNESINALTDRTIAEYRSIVDTLGCLRPTHEPRATDYIAPIKGQIAMLMMNGFAYEAEGHVLFSTDAYPEHGRLARHEAENLQTGEHRVKPASYKRNQADFVLWKPSEPGQPGWDSPWGRGRPGWHIECSAMIESIFADQTIDIHAGGGDLRFPHHDCEISQYACSHHRPNRVLANYWLHNGMLVTGGKKMAKSAGNFSTVRDLLNDGFTGDEIRLALLQAHYRQPLDWKGHDNLLQARSTLERWRGALMPFRGRVRAAENAVASQVLTALDDDLNTPRAIALMHEAANALNVTGDEANAAGLLYVLDILGVLKDVSEDTLTPELQALFDERLEARKAGNYALSDTLRAQLSEAGILVRDSKEGTYWWRK